MTDYSFPDNMPDAIAFSDPGGAWTPVGQPELLGLSHDLREAEPGDILLAELSHDEIHGMYELALAYGPPLDAGEPELDQGDVPLWEDLITGEQGPTGREVTQFVESVRLAQQACDGDEDDRLVARIAVEEAALDLANALAPDPAEENDPMDKMFVSSNGDRHVEQADRSPSATYFLAHTDASPVSAADEAAVYRDLSNVYGTTPVVDTYGGSPYVVSRMESATETREREEFLTRAAKENEHHRVGGASWRGHTPHLSDALQAEADARPHVNFGTPAAAEVRWASGHEIVQHGVMSTDEDAPVIYAHSDPARDAWIARATKNW